MSENAGSPARAAFSSLTDSRGSGCRRALHALVTILVSGLLGLVLAASIAADPVTLSTVNAATRYGDVLRSTDGGGTWAPLNVGLVNTATGGLGLTPDVLITISTSDNQFTPGVDNQGWFSLLNVNNPLNDNYVASASPSDPHNDFFFFDLTTVADRVVSATLEVRRYISTAGSTIEFFDVSTSVADLSTRGQGGLDHLPILADLGSGTSYGSFTIGPGSTNDILSFSLNSAAVADINARLGAGYFAIGGKAITGQLFGSSFEEPQSTQQLVLVTEPGDGPFTNDPLQPGLTPIRAVHVMELRTRIDALRTSAFSWTDDPIIIGTTEVTWLHLLELQTALDQAYAERIEVHPPYTAGGVGTPIRAIHIMELRQYVIDLEGM